MQDMFEDSSNEESLQRLDLKLKSYSSLRQQQFKLDKVLWRTKCSEMTLETFGQFVGQLILVCVALESKNFHLNKNLAKMFYDMDNLYLLGISVIYGFISIIGTREGIESQAKYGFFPDVSQFIKI